MKETTHAYSTYVTYAQVNPPSKFKYFHTLKGILLAHLFTDNF